MDEQRRQRVAAHRGHPGRPAERPGAHNPVRRRREEEVGRELCFHGPIRLRLRPGLLGQLGLPPLLRRRAHPRLGQDQRRALSALPA